MYEIGSPEYIKAATISEDLREADMVKALVKSGDVLKAEITPEKLMLWLFGCHILIKTGQLFDVIKKHTIYNKELDLEKLNNIITQLQGDTLNIEGWQEQGVEGLENIPQPDAYQLELLHMVSCIPGEGAELLEMVMAHIEEDKPIDIENAREEGGDIEFYLEGARARLGITRKQTLDHNYKKLGKRYEGMKYSDKAAHERKDKE